MCLKCIEMEMGQTLKASSWIHSQRTSIGLDLMEREDGEGSSESTQTMTLLPR